MPLFFKAKSQIINMSLELKNVEKKVGIETHIYSTNLKLEKNTINVPDYPKLAQLWWQHIGEVNSGTFTPQETMDRLADEMDLVTVSYTHLTLPTNREV